jgi:hypothetical protein
VRGAVVQDVWNQILSVFPDAVQAFIDFLNEEYASESTDLWEDIEPVLAT